MNCLASIGPQAREKSRFSITVIMVLARFRSLRSLLHNCCFTICLFIFVISVQINLFAIADCINIAVK